MKRLTATSLTPRPGGYFVATFANDARATKGRRFDWIGRRYRLTSSSGRCKQVGGPKRIVPHSFPRKYEGEAPIPRPKMARHEMPGPLLAARLGVSEREIDARTETGPVPLGSRVVWVGPEAFVCVLESEFRRLGWAAPPIPASHISMAGA